MEVVNCKGDPRSMRGFRGGAMCDRFASLIVTGFLGLTIGIASEAGAGCNAIPDADSITGLQPAVPGLIGFKSALGRIDRLHLLPTKNPSFRIQPDGICVRSADGIKPIIRPVPEDLDIRDYAVSVLVKPANGGPSHALVLGAKGVCKPFGPPEKAREMKEGQIALRCEPIPPSVEHSDGRLNIRVALPGDGNLFQSSPKDKISMSGEVTVLITLKPEDVESHRALLQEIGSNGCASQCSQLMESEALACNDDIYRLTISGTFESDPIPCAVGAATVTMNNFQEQCEDTQDYPLLAPCAGNPTQLRFWQDSCGGIHIPFDWTDIRKKDQQPQSITRVVAGRSGTARIEKGKGMRIWIPGREFLGSTPYMASVGPTSTVDWRFPEIDVWYPDEPSAEMGLRGSVDKDNSIVHVYPRMPVWVVCDNVVSDEACMSVEGHEHGYGLNCACEDRYAPGCTCTKLTSPRYFACDGGDFDGMPCTRHMHCNSPAGGGPNGKCSEQPTCQPPGEAGIWKPGRDHTTGTKCWEKANCAGLGSAYECGYRLFGFDDRNQNGVIELDAKIEDLVAASKRRGACKDKRGQFCSNLPSNKKACGPQEGTCRGYTLSAHEEK
jgi:hypothetical protein